MQRVARRLVISTQDIHEENIFPGMAAPGPGMAGYSFGNTGAGAGFGGAANSNDFASADFEDQSWPQRNAAMQQRTLDRPVPSKAAKNRPTSRPTTRSIACCPSLAEFF